MINFNEPIDNVVKRLTKDYKYANDVCLLLMLKHNGEKFLRVLDYLDIREKRLETFANVCCHNMDIDYIIESTIYLYYEYIDRKDMLANLDSSNPIEFIYRLPNSAEDFYNDYIYNSYTSVFYSRFKNNSKCR